MKSSNELKQIAKEGLNGKLGGSIGALVVTGLFSCIPLCAPAATVGYNKYNIKLVRKEQVSVGEVLNGFNSFGKALWLVIITAFFTSLWSCLLCIPGIVKMFAYSMAPYILADNPNMTARESLRASKELTKGKKGELFYIHLSFIGWMILSSITLGILLLVWVAPYYNATLAAFYKEAKGDPKPEFAGAAV